MRVPPEIVRALVLRTTRVVGSGGGRKRNGSGTGGVPVLIVPVNPEPVYPPEMSNSGADTEPPPLLTAASTLSEFTSTGAFNTDDLPVPTTFSAAFMCRSSTRMPFLYGAHMPRATARARIGIVALE